MLQIKPIDYEQEFWSSLKWTLRVKCETHVSTDWLIEYVGFSRVHVYEFENVGKFIANRKMT